MNRWPRVSSLSRQPLGCRQLKGRKITVACFTYGKTALCKGGTASRLPGEPIPFFRPGCNPQPAKCLIAQYVLRHCCVYGLSGKILVIHPNSIGLTLFLAFPRCRVKNGNIIPLLSLRAQDDFIRDEKFIPSFKTNCSAFQQTV
ncbi:hypothetical protein CQW29_11210 [Pantoea coffeiphila]|uniref:Uncharacterized protein n=1 Tax=Pantoea coffeiphila TaxID=1465635 RepID=A0A2S9ICR1_9GAMM|nr:hypothetical protein CQW29_11210 [Pantoea coffeiphila]